MLDWSLACAAASALLPLGCKTEQPSRAGVLRATVREIVVPETRAVVTLSERLEGAAVDLFQNPSAKSVQAARGTWKRAAVAWKRVQCFRSGPIVETAALARASFWPARPAVLDQILAGEGPVDARFVAELGADVKGLFALEYLLFQEGGDATASAERFKGAFGTRRRTLALELARSIAAHARQASRVLGDGAQFADRFALGGGESLGLLVGELIVTLETLVVERLDHVIGLDKNGRLATRAVEGGLSGTSHELAVAQFLATDRLYRGGSGGGIADLVEAAAPRVAERVAERWTTARDAVRTLTAPLEELVKSDRPRLVAVVRALKMLEVSCKLEVASSLGLTLSFPGGDGD